MIQFVYPGGKKRVVTFSYDDGSENDARLIALFNQYGVKATFHLIGSRLLGKDAQKLRSMYAGHEVASHTLTHGWLDRMPAQSVASEITEDRKVLENIFGYPIVGMSYPNGCYNAEVIATVKACGILYSRTVVNTNRFSLPEEFLQWNPTCHHKDALPLCETFLQGIDSEYRQPMLYIWGHSHDLRTEEDWFYMETLLKKLSGSEKIWYATNIDIYNYMTAFRRLQVSADETVFYNPSDIPVWVERNKVEILEIPAGKTVRL